MDKKTLKELAEEIYYKSGMTEEEIAEKLSTETDIIARATFSRWRSGAIKGTLHKRHVRVIALHRSVMRVHKRKMKLNDK